MACRGASSASGSRATKRLRSGALRTTVDPVGAILPRSIATRR